MKSALKEQKKRDLWRACLHEAAHLVIARHFKVSGHIRVAEHTNGGTEERYFVGQFHPLSKITTVKAKRAIGLAGSMAELLEEDSTLTECDCDDLELSESDATLANGYQVRDIGRTLELLRENWPEILQEASDRGTGMI